MSDAKIGWKFGADIKGPDGHFGTRTCYVAIADRKEALQALADENPGLAIHPGPGQAVSADEWTAVFDTAPTAREVRCDG